MLKRTRAETSNLCPAGIEVDILATPKLSLIKDFWGVLKQLEEVDRRDRDPNFESF